MGRRKRIDHELLAEMVRNNVTTGACAKHFGVSPQAVSNAKKKLKLTSGKVVALEKANHVVTKSLNTLGQLQKINDNANELLDMLMAWNRGKPGALQVLESQAKQVKVGSKEDAEWITEYKMTDPRALALKAMSEIRSQLKLQLELYQALWDAQAIKDFQQEVLDVIGSVSPEHRAKIISGLAARRAIRSVVQFDQ